MGNVISLADFRTERAVLTREERIASLLALLPLAPDLEREIIRLRNEIWLIEGGEFTARAKPID